MALSEDWDRTSVFVSRLLAGGMAASVALLAAGVLSSSEATMRLGLLALLATPAARVAALAWEFGRRREWTFLLCSLFVLAVLAASVLLGRASE